MLRYKYILDAGKSWFFSDPKDYRSKVMKKGKNLGLIPGNWWIGVNMRGYVCTTYSSREIQVFSVGSDAATTNGYIPIQ